MAKGVAGEEAVSAAIGVARNVGAGRITIPGLGPGGIRVPDFSPLLTILLRGAVVEVKNVATLKWSQQLADLLAYAQSKGAILEIWTNAAAPAAGKLADAIERGWVKLVPIP
ncbi:MAG: Restriction endonuclease fold toxin 7 [Chloroflexota bacterium]|nr:Restriction endonuclease fold toxin 7 [Chloroflexota bacterium]